jgi:hypothetical protein
MTPSVATNPNGRKTLASQLDRLDDILTGLSEALNESVSTAVEKAVASVLTEILANPSFAERLRGPVILPLPDRAVPDAPLPPAKRQVGLPSKMGRALRASWSCVRRAARAVLRHGNALAQSAGACVFGMLRRGRALATTAALATAGLATYVAGPRLWGLLTTVADRLRSRGTTLRTSMRRNNRRFAPASP